MFHSRFIIALLSIVFLFGLNVDFLSSSCLTEEFSKFISLDLLLRGPAMTEIVIKKVNNEEVKLFYVKPTDSKINKKRTAVVWIHGGGWTGGVTETFFPHARYFASRGAVGFCIHYRLVKADGSVTVADCLADCKSAIRYIREHADELDIDPVKIIVMGESAGGHLASCLGTVKGFDSPTDNLKVSEVPNVMVLYNPLSDFSTNPLITRIIGGAALNKNPTPESQIPSAEQLELARKLSPIFNVHQHQPPTLIIHGTDDTVILPEQSVKFTQAMKKAGNKCQLILLPETKHAFVCVKWKSTEPEVVNAIRIADNFLVKSGYLKGKPTLVPSKIPAWTPMVIKK